MLIFAHLYNFEVLLKIYGKAPMLNCACECVKHYSFHPGYKHYPIFVDKWHTTSMSKSQALRTTQVDQRIIFMQTQVSHYVGPANDCRTIKMFSLSLLISARSYFERLL